MIVCHTGAIYWDADGINALGEKGMLGIDNSKCISCGKCVGDEGCPVGAILFAQSDTEMVELIRGTETDINKVKALFVDRYGAEIIDENICIDANELSKVLGAGVTIVEEFADWSIQCLLTSIPIESIIRTVCGLIEVETARYFKCDCTSIKDENDMLPFLKVFKNGDLVAQAGGVYGNAQFKELEAALWDSMR
jgi:ferredoxin